MTLDQLLEKNKLTAKDIESYFTEVGLKKIKKADLDLIIKKFGSEVQYMANFGLVYEMKLKESNKRLLFWIVLMAIMIGCIGVWRWLTMPTG